MNDGGLFCHTVERLAVLPWLNFVPGLLGALVGAPLVARELEQRTHLLAWTQGVTRRRWLATKLAVLVLAIVMLGIAFIALISWWRRPLDRLEGRFQPNSFEFEGLVPTAYTLSHLPSAASWVSCCGAPCPLWPSWSRLSS